LGNKKMKTLALQNQANRKSPCIWMQAGVVRQKNCALDYDCPACHFDRTLQRVAVENGHIRELGGSPRGKRGRIVFWRDRLNELPSSRRPCVHHMKGRITFRACTLEYKCGECEFDQYFEDQFSVHAVVRPVDVMNIKGFKVPQGVYLHPGHTWLKIESSSTVRVGLDDFALRLLGPLDKISAPFIGQEVEQGRADISARRGEREARFLSPVSGVVTSFNTRLMEDSNLPANKDPYAAGWVLQAHSENLRRELQNLMIGDETESFYTREVDRLYEEIEVVAGPLAADGGYLGEDIYGNLPELGWERMTRLFLRS
jgi:glycine cleavage system H lipoate-binding protein